jgi:hypothetical protein
MNTILEALGKMPFVRVDQEFNKIHQQAAQQKDDES